MVWLWLNENRIVTGEKKRRLPCTVPPLFFIACARFSPYARVVKPTAAVFAACLSENRYCYPMVLQIRVLHSIKQEQNRKQAEKDAHHVGKRCWDQKNWSKSGAKVGQKWGKIYPWTGEEEDVIVLFYVPLLFFIAWAGSLPFAPY